ncbi:alginate export family protein [Sphingomonas sp. RP10(2022)]|uniref:Alginate export family protein n=1 Tax=Sphingomonas liriopis TaxID=2949094 RepID=A0A9X2HYW7_9SPHN|nr:alginate export family protein [Sphingomonas liriopis]MCP3734640.1 alginate export family protein [Sphingomonas liriopis]
MRTIAILAASAAALPCGPAMAQVSVSGTTRLRVETIDGQARAGFNASDTLLNLRTTLAAQYEDGPVKVVGELWDSRVYGDNAGTPLSTGEVNTLELVQVYIEWKPTSAFGRSTAATIQAGRLLLNLGSRRLVAADDYRNTTNGYTGVRADLAWPGGWKSTAIYVLPQQRRPDDLPSLRRKRVAPDREGFDLVLWGGLLSRSNTIGRATVETSFFHLGERDRPGRPTRDRSLNTGALRVIADPIAGGVDYEVEGILQRGRVSTSLAANASRQDVSAWFVHGDIGYTFQAGWKPRIALEYDHASGDRPSGDYGRFDTLFGMRRADLAPAGLYNAIIRSNLVSPGVRFEATPDERTDLMASLRPFWLAARQDAFSFTGVRDATGRSGSFAGSQFDGRVRHQLSKALRLELDAVLFAKGEFLRMAPNARPGRWTKYVSLNATAVF